MNYLLIVLGILRELFSREPQCLWALAAGLLATAVVLRGRLQAIRPRIAIDPQRRGSPAASV